MNLQKFTAESGVGIRHI